MHVLIGAVDWVWLQISMSASSHMKRVGASVNVSTRSGQWIAGARLEHMATLASKVAASRLAPVPEVSITIDLL